MGFWNNIFNSHSETTKMFMEYEPHDNIVFEFPNGAKIATYDTAPQTVHLFLNKNKNLVIRKYNGEENEINQKDFLNMFNLTHKCLSSICVVDISKNEYLEFKKHEDIGIIISAFGYYNKH